MSNAQSDETEVENKDDTEYEEDTVGGVEEDITQELNEIDAEGHLDKALKGSLVEVQGSDNDTLDEEVNESEHELRNLYEL